MKSTGARTPMNLDSKDLIFIYALNKMKTLDAAAQLLDKDTSSVFRAIQRIEKSIGKPIFTRSNKGFSPTMLCELLSEKGELIYSALSTANDLLLDDTAVFEEVLKITTTDFLLHHCVMPLVHEFSNDYPNVKFEFDVSSSDDKLWERNNDIAIRPTNSPPEQMIGHRLSELGYCVVSNQRYMQRIQEQDLPIRWLIFDRATKKHFIKKWFENNVGADQSSLKFDSMHDLFHAIKSGYGVGVIPNLKTATQDLLKLENYNIDETVSIWMLYHPSSKKRVLVKRFADCVLANKSLFY
ncbi:MAG: LysR family transcriptional regulator [Oceanospirillaceae bacterium]